MDSNLTILADCFKTTELFLDLTGFEPDTTYNFAYRNYVTLPDGSIFYSKFSTIETFRTAKEPDLNIKLVTAFDGKTTVTVDITNPGTSSMLLLPNPSYGLSLINPDADINIVSKDTANVALVNFTLAPGATKRLSFTLTTAGYTFNTSLYITFEVIYDDISYIVFYNPYDTILFVY